MARRWLLIQGLILALASAALAQQPADLEAVVATDMGTFRFEFAADKAPKHVDQFIRLARQGYYDGSAFHRVVANGIIQGGDPLLKNAKTAKNLWGSGGLNLLPGELSDMKHERGVVSTVRLPNRPDSDGAQFFVCIVPQPSLDGQYTAFGRVNEGMDVVEKISRVQANADGITAVPVRILKVTIEPKKVQPFLTAMPDEMRKTVRVKTTLGEIRIQMQPDWARENVRNFLMLTASGWFNGTVFHRVAKGFVVQGGTAPERPHVADRWVHPVKGEFRTDVKHVRGIVSMAHGEDPNSATTSFFIVLGPAENLDGQYSAFGKIVGGMEVLDAFEKEDVDGETPKRRLEILEAVIE